MEIADLTTALQNRMGSLFTKLTSDGVTQAISDMLLETGWSLPISDSYNVKCLWAINRTQRHALHILLTESADKFKHKQENLQHRFEHYSRMIRQMDSDFKEAIEEYPDVFSGVDPSKAFGTHIDAGFVYTATGRDVTYDYLQDSSSVDPDSNDFQGS